MSKLLKIAIVSGKGGVGKTTTTLNIALALYKLGVNVMLVDGNISTPNLGLYLGIIKTPTTLNNVLRGEVHISKTIYKHSSGLKIIPSDLDVEALQNIDFNKLKKVIPQLENHADILIVDTAAGLGSETQNVLKAVDEAIIVTNTDKGALVDALKTIETSKRLGTPVIGVIINRTKGKINNKDIEKLLGVSIIGTIKEDNKIAKSTENSNIYLETYKTSNTNRYYEIASKFLGKSYIKQIKKDEKKSLFNYVIKQLGLKGGKE